jgi:uncharacterized sulfatase
MSRLISRRGLLASGAWWGAARAERPNILWITCEDLSPILGCYGDRYACTPHLDRLASEGVRFERAFASASVCGPARSCLITGMTATALGTMHLRGMQPLPAGVTCFPEYLRRAGYYASNNEKQDYNFVAPAAAWDESSDRAHYRNRRPGQPFFAVFNLMATHQGQIRYSRAEFERVSATLPAPQRRDPAQAPLPPYYPDTPLTRLNIAELYTQTTIMDAQAGGILNELERAGLAEETIVFWFSDHGTGLPRAKRWLHESGTRVPLIARFPKKYAHLAPGRAGTVSRRMVSFADFAPSMLALAGLEAPEYMQGAPFVGPKPGREREYVFFHSDRVGEVVECGRAVRDGRYRYIRNFLPHRPRMQHSVYSELGLVRQELRRLGAEGKLRGEEALLLAPTIPTEELYDHQADPHEIRNLAGRPEHAATLRRMKQRLFAWMEETRDTGLLPEADMQERARGGSPREMEWPVRRVLAAADRVGRGQEQEKELRALLGDADAAVRYWGVVGLTCLGLPAEEVLGDASASVRIAAAESALRCGPSSAAREVLEKELLSADSVVALNAANAFWYLGEQARASAPALRRALAEKGGPAVQRGYARDAMQKTLDRLG